MNKALPDGQIYVCGACGKTSKTKAPGHDSALGWDASCMLNRVRCYESHLVRSPSGRVTHVNDGGVVEEASP